MAAPKLISLMSQAAWRDLPSKYDATSSTAAATATTYTTFTTDLADALYPQPDPHIPFLFILRGESDTPAWGSPRRCQLPLLTIAEVKRVCSLCSDMGK